MFDYVSIAFYKGESNDTSIINRITKLLTGDFVHCEIVFSETAVGNNLACGIWQGENVFYRKKTFGRKNWVFKKIRLSKEQVAKIKNFCKEMAENKIPFNYAGFLRAMTAYPRFTDKTCFFCSELIITAFHEAGLMLDVDSSCTTPTMLYQYIKKISFPDVSPVYERRITKTPLTFMKRFK